MGGNFNYMGWYRRASGKAPFFISRYISMGFVNTPFSKFKYMNDNFTVTLDYCRVSRQTILIILMPSATLIVIFSKTNTIKNVLYA